jgi:hypothetical protein
MTASARDDALTGDRRPLCASGVVKCLRCSVSIPAHLIDVPGRCIDPNCPLSGVKRSMAMPDRSEQTNTQALP